MRTQDRTRSILFISVQLYERNRIKIIEVGPSKRRMKSPAVSDGWLCQKTAHAP